MDPSKTVRPEKDQPKPVVSSDVATDLPTLASSMKPKAGDIVTRHALRDGGRLMRRQRGHETLYHLKVPDGRQIYLEKKPDSLGLLITDKRGKLVMTMGCDL